MRRMIAVSFAITIAAPALAAPPPAALAVLLDFTNPEQTVQVMEPAFGDMSLGLERLVLGETTLENTAASFGGTVSVDLELGVGLAWICYLAPSPDGILRVSLLGLAEEVDSEHPVLGIAVEPQDAATDALHGCEPGYANLTLPGLGIPAPGETRAALEARYGTPLPATPRINIVHERVEDGTLILQQLQYHFAGDTIVSVGLTETRL